MDAVDCQVFEDQLHAADAGELPAGAAPLFRAHAAACGRCRGLLNLHDHLHDRLSGRSLAELEALVPEAWVTGMEPAVLRRLAEVPGSVVASASAAGPGGLRVPLLAAAVVALLISTTLSLRALHVSRGRVDALAAEVLDQQRRLAEVGGPIAMASRNSFASPPVESWLQSLATQPDLTLGDLRDRLDRLPGDTTLVDPVRTRELARSRWIPSPWREAFETLPSDRGATAADLLGVLDRIGLPGDAAVPTRRLLDLLG